MQNRENDLQPFLSHAEPVFPVTDVSETVSYWRDVLGFPNPMIWGEPPNHGAVSWGGAHVQFSQNPEVAATSKGLYIWIRVRRIEALYALHQRKNAQIVDPLANRPYGFAEYTVREINGYYVSFAEPVSEREKSAEMLPPSIRIVARPPTVPEYRSLVAAVGWSTSANDALLESQLASALFAVVAETTPTGDVVGCAFLLGDFASFYYVKDVMVHPAWQSKRIGTALIQELMHWVETNVPNPATIGLVTGENLAPFYQQFGFTPVFGMQKSIHRT